MVMPHGCPLLTDGYADLQHLALVELLKCSTTVRQYSSFKFTFYYNLFRILASSPKSYWTVLFGPWGPTTGLILIIRTVQRVKLVEYFMSVKNHVDQISIAISSTRRDLHINGSDYQNGTHGGPPRAEQPRPVRSRIGGKLFPFRNILDVILKSKNCILNLTTFQTCDRKYDPKKLKIHISPKTNNLETNMAKIIKLFGFNMQMGLYSNQGTDYMGWLWAPTLIQSKLCFLSRHFAIPLLVSTEQIIISRPSHTLNHKYKIEVQDVYQRKSVNMLKIVNENFIQKEPLLSILKHKLKSYSFEESKIIDSGSDWNEPKANKCLGQTAPLVASSTYAGKYPPVVEVVKRAIRKIKNPKIFIDESMQIRYRTSINRSLDLIEAPSSSQPTEKRNISWDSPIPNMFTDWNMSTKGGITERVKGRNRELTRACRSIFPNKTVSPEKSQRKG
ncbi:hypothetical protein HYC85_011272 [Camellia sinensis]|uniref:Uncharacterized protein n=1 Tax=Camellia sinensis TaxID=4442 RepID=A0A7J7H8V6_CAMSI|nr:hypothetical protein HYC85_011272 [Camellia sinensis]